MSKLNKLYKFVKHPVVSGIMNASLIIFCVSEIVNQTSNVYLMVILIMHLVIECMNDYSDRLENRVEELESELESLDKELESLDKK